MRREVSNIFSNQYLLAKGGRNAMFQADLDAIQEMLTTQYTFLQNFAEKVRVGEYSQAQIAAYSELYLDSSTQSHERGKAGRHGAWCCLSIQETEVRFVRCGVGVDGI